MRNGLDEQYIDLLKDILENGVVKETRNGGTISVFGRQIRHKMSEGFPLLTTKKMPFKTITTELLWFLRGDTNIKYLVDNNCHIWDGDAHQAYLKGWEPQKVEVEENPMSWMEQKLTNDRALPQDMFIHMIKTDDEFAQKFGELGPIYGKQWRSWETFTYDDYANRPKWMKDNPIDQIANLINDLKTNPDSRRLMVNAWNPADLEAAVLPPCHYGFQVYTRELSLEERLECLNKIKDKNGLFITKLPHKHLHELFEKHNIPTRAISLMFNMRSNDVPLGLPFNIASYGLLLEIISKMVNMIPDELVASLGDAHIYKNQVDGIKEQLTRSPMKLPTLIISEKLNFNGTIDDFLESCNKDCFKLDGYESHPSIKMPLSN